MPMLTDEQKLLISNKVRCEKSFYYFVTQAWLVVDSDDFIPNWHIHCICVHMEALNKREITILDVNIPPGFAKSLICSVLYPAWVWINDPSRRFLTGSHNMELAIRDTLKCRRLIESQWYQSRWGNVYQLTTDQNTKSNYQNNKHGYRIAFSSTGGTTGLRGDDILLDDALSQSQAESDTERGNVNDFLKHTLFSRQNITKKTAIMGIGQRFHPHDYHSVLLSLPGCFHLVLPLQFIPEDEFSSPYFKDPRKERDEVLWKIPKFNVDGLAVIKQIYGNMQYSAQYQQRPQLQEGSYLKRSDWRYYEPKDLPANLKKVSGWDFAAKTASQNDFTVCLSFGKCGDKFFILDLYRKKVEYPQAKKDFIEHMDQFRPQKSYIEDASNGTPLISDLKTTKYFSSITPISTKGKDKLARVIPITPIVEANNVFLPKDAPWLDTFIEECANFPNGDHDDIVDVLSMVLNNERRNIGNILAYI